MFFRRVSEIFVNAFGITKPEAARAERDGMIITGAIVVILILLAGFAYLLMRIIS
jgi:hypothetical protein